MCPIEPTKRNEASLNVNPFVACQVAGRRLKEQASHVGIPRRHTARADTDMRDVSIGPTSLALEVENLVARGEHQFELACAVASPVRRRAVLIILTTRVGIEGDRGFEQNCGTG